MPTDIEESNEYIKGTPYYILRLYGPLINGQKAAITITGIKVFFDIRIPDNKDIYLFEVEIKNILANEKDDKEKAVDLSKIKIEHIKAFPIRGYHTEKKPYLRIYTSGTGKRKTAMQAIQDNNYETASDDMYSFHRKVARENGIQLSGWSRINKYICKKGKRTSPLCPHEFYVSIKDFCPLEDFTTISDRFSITALLRDRTLVHGATRSPTGDRA